VLRAIELQDFAIADAVEVALGPGLNVLTGETGAGKSLVVDALALAAGARADAGVVRSGAPFALIQLHFEPPTPVTTAARRIVPEGRNLARLDGEVVTVAELQSALDALVGIFGQHAFRTLLDAPQQRRALDRQLDDAGLAAAAEYRSSHERLVEVEARLGDRRAAGADRERRLDLLRYQLQELDAAGVEPGEADALEARLATLRNVERVRGAVAGALDALAAGDTPAVDGLAQALRALEGATRHAATLEPLADDLRAALTGASAVGSELESFLESLDADPGELDRVEARHAELERLFRKYGGDEAGLLQEHRRLRVEADDLERLEIDLAELEAERGELRRERQERGEALSLARAAAAAELGSAVSETLRELALPHARFEVALEPLAEPAAHGLERVEFRFSANLGEPPAALSAVASGGELSRVMLALHVVAGSDRPVLAFDEVDAGVGGHTGRAVGRLLKRLAAQRQVLVVTHLAQVAAFADRHLRVDKVTEDGRSVTRVRVLDGEERVLELARMLAGDEGVTARRHAEELLAAAS
jgi:DNA repair protein RecN (Recombination protein N)